MKLTNYNPVIKIDKQYLIARIDIKKKQTRLSNKNAIQICHTFCQ